MYRSDVRLRQRRKCSGTDAEPDSDTESGGCTKSVAAAGAESVADTGADGFGTDVADTGADCAAAEQDNGRLRHLHLQ